MGEKTMVDVQLKALEVLEAQAEAVRLLAGDLGTSQRNGVDGKWNKGEFKLADDGSVHFVLADGEELEKQRLIVCGGTVLVEFELSDGKQPLDSQREKLLGALKGFLDQHGVASPVAYLAGTCSHHPHKGPGC